MDWGRIGSACSVAIAMLLAGCGGLLDGPRGTADAGADGVGDDGSDASPVDGGDAAPTSGPIQLANVRNAVIYGVTDGGRIIYGTLPPSDVWSVPFTGGEMPTKISPPGFAPPDAASYSGGAQVFHHVVVMSAVSQAAEQSPPPMPGTYAAWDERTGVTTTLTPPPQMYPDGVRVSPDSQYMATEWAPLTGSGTSPWSWSVSKVDGSDSVSFGSKAILAYFDRDRIVYSMWGQYEGAPGAPLVSLDAANGGASVTLSTNASSYAVDAIGSRALVANGPFPNGGQGVFLAPLDGGAPVMIDPTGGGSTLYLSADSTFAMYVAEAGTANAHLAAVTLPTSGPPGTPYPVPASALSTGTPYSAVVAVLPHAPTGPVAIIAVNSSSTPSPLAIVGVGPGATAPNLVVPYSDFDGFTSDESRVLINRPSVPVGAGALTVYPLPGGPESAPLSTSSYGWIALGGSTVLFTDNWSGGTADLRIADVAKGTSSKLIASGTTCYTIPTACYGISPDRKLLAYTYVDAAAVQSSADGVWVTALPNP